MKNKIIAILLVLILSVNFIGEVKVKANPAIPIVGGAALLGFLLTASAIGLEFNSVAEANKIMQDFESKNNFNGSPNKPPNFTKIGLILGLAGLAKKGDDQFAEQYREYRDNLVDYFKNEFKNLVEGENNVSVDGYNFISDGSIITESGNYITQLTYAGTLSPIEVYLPFNLTFNSNIVTVTYIDNTSYTYEYNQNANYQDLLVYQVRNIGARKLVTNGYAFELTMFNRSFYKPTKEFVNSSSYQSLFLNMSNSSRIDKLITDLDSLNIDDFNFNIDPESPLLDETKPDLPNKPNITGLENVKEVVNNNGTTSYIYNGTSDELVQELINTISLDRLVNPNDYTMTEKENGQITVTPPDPNINPFEQTDSSNEVGLLQQIINWLKRLWELPTTIIQDLFTVPEDLTLDTSKLRLNQFQLKFPFSIPWDLYKSIEVFAVGMSDPSLEIDLDTEFFQVYHKIDLSKIALPLSFFRYCVVIFFIMFLINKTRDLIKW